MKIIKESNPEIQVFVKSFGSIEDGVNIISTYKLVINVS